MFCRTNECDLLLEVQLLCSQNLLRSFQRCLEPAFHAVFEAVLAEMHMEVLLIWETPA